LLAGAVLIANAVGLGMIERRREIGIFKAIGWTRRHVLGGVLLENGLVGTLAALTGMAAVALAVRFTNLRIGSRVVWMEPAPSLVLAVSAIAIALGAAAVVAWRPTRVRPLVTLREE